MGDINLAKKAVWSAKERRIIYKWMLVYLLVCLLLLPVVAYRASVKIRDGIAASHQVQNIQQRFRQEHPDQGSMLIYANALRDSLGRDAAHAAAVSAAFPHTAHSMLPLLDLILHQNGDSMINRLAFEQEDRNRRSSLEFSLALPESSARADSTTLLRNWRGDPTLVRQFSAIVPINTERGNVMGQDMMMMRYRAIFREQ
jgi:hypothetical protein